MDAVKPIARGALLRQPLVVLAPHPDDETIGCGGLIAECLARKQPLLLVLATDGGASHPGTAGWPRPRRARHRAQEMRAAVSRLGGGRRHLRSLGLPDGAMPTAGPAFLTAVTTLCRAMRTVRAKILVAPSRADEHRDHRACFRLATIAARRCGARLAEYAVWGALPPGPRCAVPALRHARRRGAALERHHSQMGRSPAGFGEGFVVPPELRAAARRGLEHFRIDRR